MESNGVQNLGKLQHGSSVGCTAAWYAACHGFDILSATFFRGDWSYNNFSKAILSLPLIQEGQLSVTGKRMCTKYR